MSAIINSLDSQRGGKRFGIEAFRGKGEYGIKLPVAFSMKDFSQFGMDMFGLYDSLDLKVKDYGFEVSAKKGMLFPVKAKYEIIPERDSIIIKASTNLFGKERIEDKCLIDNSIGKTVLGRRLMDYWMKTENISLEESQKRLKNIAQYMGIVQ